MSNGYSPTDSISGATTWTWRRSPSSRRPSALANTPALLLGGSADALEQFNYEGSYKETITTWVRLAPKNTDSGFIRVELGFVDDTLSRMVFFDNLEQTTLVEMRDVTVNEIIDPARFRFDVPDDVDVVGSPVVADLTDH